MFTVGGGAPSESRSEMAAVGRVERTRPRPTGEEGKLSAESIFPLQCNGRTRETVRGWQARRGGALQAWRPSFLSPGLSSLPSAPPPRSEQSGLATSTDPPARSADRARGRDQPTDRTAPPHHSALRTTATASSLRPSLSLHWPQQRSYPNSRPS